MKFTEKEILEELDMAFNGTPGRYYPQITLGNTPFIFFLDLEHGYCDTAGSRIHLYGDSTRWAVVFEKSGYQNRGFRAEIELIYVGNCIELLVDHYPDRIYISNMRNVVLIDSDEFERIENKDGKEMETFELIGPDTTEIKVRDNVVPFDGNHLNYIEVGIVIREDENPKKLIGFGDLIRYWHETDPDIISANESEIRQNIPADIPKLMTINEFHFSSWYNKSLKPSEQETYGLIANVLVTGDKSHWKPTRLPNNSWKNWESGNL